MLVPTGQYFEPEIGKSNNRRANPKEIRQFRPECLDYDDNTATDQRGGDSHLEKRADPHPMLTRPRRPPTAACSSTFGEE